MQLALTTLAGAAPDPSFEAGASLVHPEYPLEQRVLGADAPTQGALMRFAAHVADEGVLALAAVNGLRLLGRHEAALDRALAPLRVRFGAALRVAAPTVRTVPGSPSLEPWMTVFVSAAASALPRVERDFARRGGTALRLSRRDPFVLEGEAPLASLLGYERWLRERARDAHASLELRCYRPVPEGPRAA